MRQSEVVVRAGNATMSIEAVRGGVETIDCMAEQWRELCGESSNDEPFFRPEWIAAYVRAFAPDKTVVLVTARTEGRLRAVLPLVEERTSFLGWPVTKLRGAANIHSSRFDLARSAGPEGDQASLAIWEYLRNDLQWDSIEFPHVPVSGEVESWSIAAMENGFHISKTHPLRTPYVRLVPWEGDWDWWLGRLSGNFRHNLRRRVRKLPGELKLRRMESADPEALRLFYEMEMSGWKGDDGGAIACSPATLNFYNEIARVGQQYGYLTLYFLELCGTPIAAQFGLTYRGRYFVPKCAYDETMGQFSPGHLLVNYILRDLANRGLSEFDFLGPWMEWKANWTPLVHTHNTLHIFRNTLAGSALYATQFRWRGLARKFLGLNGSGK